MFSYDQLDQLAHLVDRSTMNLNALSTVSSVAYAEPLTFSYAMYSYPQTDATKYDDRTSDIYIFIPNLINIWILLGAYYMPRHLAYTPLYTLLAIFL